MNVSVFDNSVNAFPDGFHFEIFWSMRNEWVVLEARWILGGARYNLFADESRRTSTSIMKESKAGLSIANQLENSCGKQVRAFLGYSITNVMSISWIMPRIISPGNEPKAVQTTRNNVDICRRKCPSWVHHRSCPQPSGNYNCPMANRVVLNRFRYIWHDSYSCDIDLRSTRWRLCTSRWSSPLFLIKWA